MSREILCPMCKKSFFPQFSRAGVWCDRCGDRYPTNTLRAVSGKISKDQPVGREGGPEYVPLDLADIKVNLGPDSEYVKAVARRQKRQDRDARYKAKQQKST